MVVAAIPPTDSTSLNLTVSLVDLPWFGSFTDTTADQGAADKLTVNLAESTSVNKVMNVTSNEAVFFDNLVNMTALEVKSAQNTTTLNESTKTSKNHSSGIEVTSPIIGTAYHAPEPGAKKFVEIGKKIKKGDTVMIIEAMKTMNHVPSSSDGVVSEICVDDGQPVEFDQKIIILK